jgi:hypothetical protein
MEEPLDVRDYEWSHITLAFATAGRSDLSNEAKKVRDLRNRLVHGGPADHATAIRAAAAVSEASRVFRRLLFVRRSHDECYKEQVFT